jgi:hypothetical protein
MSDGAHGFLQQLTARAGFAGILQSLQRLERVSTPSAFAKMRAWAVLWRKRHPGPKVTPGQAYSLHSKVAAPRALSRTKGFPMAERSNITIKFIRTVEFGLALGCVWAAWSAGGDMSLVAPALILGLIFALIGIGTIPEMPRLYKLGPAGAVTAIYFGIGWFLHWHFEPHAAPREPTTPAVQAPMPAKPSETWVSEEESRQAKGKGRLLLPFRPNELASMNYSMGYKGTDAYVGNWVKIDNPVLKVDRLVEKDKKEYLVVTILQPVWTAVLIFDAQKWGDQIRVMNPNNGAKVHALCQLAKYDKGPNDLAAAKFIGSNCELL